ncbi:MAG: ADP-ribosylglycohydrolase family protein [Jatrophihabitans sp.]
MILTSAQVDRARGVLLGTAAGDALGAPYEFQPARGPELDVAMVGGGRFRWSPGEWTDDTAMAIVIAQIAATGADLRDPLAQEQILRRWQNWARSAPDVGVQTRAVLSAVNLRSTAEDAVYAARRLHETSGRSGGNGSLMRTAPVALAHLDDEDALADAARQVGALTHFDPDAGDACVLWCLAIRHAVLTGELDVRRGLPRLGPQAATWAGRLDAAERARPADFTHNGWVVEALQGAWSAITSTATLVDGLDAAVRSGNDTDTVAAIAGGLLGAVHGAGAVPADWCAVLHGWPGLDADDLVDLADAIVG